ncbi:hypothetical protein L1887_31547 [Cichorium endivia]|nr:hypothetical protein L1887_31547 [Cichorium endivia]
MIKELNSYVALRKTYQSTLGNKRVELFDMGAGVSEPMAGDNDQVASEMSNQELLQADMHTMNETDQHSTLKKQPNYTIFFFSQKTATFYVLPENEENGVYIDTEEQCNNTNRRQKSESLGHSVRNGGQDKSVGGNGSIILSYVFFKEDEEALDRASHLLYVALMGTLLSYYDQCHCGSNALKSLVKLFMLRWSKIAL